MAGESQVVSELHGNGLQLPGPDWSLKLRSVLAWSTLAHEPPGCRVC